MVHSEWTNHNTRTCNVILELVLWLVNSNNGRQGFRTLDWLVIVVCSGEQINLERRDCWNVRWANDDPTQLALNEKTKLTIFHDRTHEDPMVTSAFVSVMKDHEVECVLLDDIMKRPEDPQPADIFVQESEMLRKVRRTIEQSGIEAAKVWMYIK